MLYIPTAKSPPVRRFLANTSDLPLPPERHAAGSTTASFAADARACLPESIGRAAIGREFGGGSRRSHEVGPPSVSGQFQAPPGNPTPPHRPAKHPHATWAPKATEGAQRRPERTDDDYTTGPDPANEGPTAEPPRGHSHGPHRMDGRKVREQKSAMVARQFGEEVDHRARHRCAARVDFPTHDPEAGAPSSQSQVNGGAGNSRGPPAWRLTSGPEPGAFSVWVGVAGSPRGRAERSQIEQRQHLGVSRGRGGSRRGLVWHRRWVRDAFTRRHPPVELGAHETAKHLRHVLAVGEAPGTELEPGVVVDVDPRRLLLEDRPPVPW